MKSNTNRPASERREPTGAPVVRGDPNLTGQRATTATEFDPTDPESLEAAVTEVRSFATEQASSEPFEILCGAAACATLVRGEDSYQQAARRAGEGVTVTFLRKWARVHDLPLAIRRSIALREIVPSAAQHVARLQGEDRFLLAWAIVDHELPVRDVRSIASAVTDGASIRAVLDRQDVMPETRTVSLSPQLYHEVRLAGGESGREPESIVAEAIEQWFES